MDSNNHDLPGGDPWDDEPSTGTGARRRWPWAAAIVALAVAAVAGGVAVAGNMGSAGRAPAAASTAAVMAPTASASLTATPSPIVATSVSATPPSSVPPSSSATSAAATPAPSAGAWRTFTSADSKVSFDYPASWRVSDAGGGSGGVDVDVANEAAVVVASLHLGPSGGLGGACQGDVPYTVLDSAEVDLPHQPAKGAVTPRFAFRALQEPNRVTASFGLTDTPAGQNGSTCMFYNVVTGPPEWPMFSFADAFQVQAGGSEDDPMHKGAKTFPSLDAARAYMQTPEYLNAKRMITSLKIKEG
ncbi:hypothetical protein [Arthrobacter sp. NPDC058192]|uniref:hypothetical protein n=1 Tax=Arthrobacter sp. NPDC058192 TaxID=3346372 RepID=UPI0036E936EA